MGCDGVGSSSIFIVRNAYTSESDCTGVVMLKVEEFSGGFVDTVLAFKRAS